MEISRQYAMIAERDLKALQARVEAALIQAAETERHQTAPWRRYMQTSHLAASTRSKNQMTGRIGITVGLERFLLHLMQYGL